VRKKTSYKLLKAHHPKMFEKNVYVVSFAKKNKPLTDENTRLIIVKSNNKTNAIKKAKKIIQKR